MNLKTPALVAVLGFSVLSLSAQAASGDVTQDQVNSISAGQSAADVVNTLGQPINSPTWSDGTSSLIYAVTDDNDATQRAYVSIENGKVTDVQFGDDGGNSVNTSD